ncbi:MAG: WbqC family protein [Bacteroidetes bacterium]|nr:WbqC family protein [Bacteroidota bacterium]
MPEKESIILSTAYLGPICYYSRFFLPYPVLIEKNENYLKQSYRNRCVIYGANGPLTLAVPVQRGSFHKTAINELEIDYVTDWQANHLRSIISSYKSAPFFEFYIDDLIPCYQQKIRYLIDYNTSLMKILLRHLEIKQGFSFTKSFIKQYPSKLLDFREKIHPKKTFRDPFFKNLEYTQVFSPKHGFIPNLSILDLLFNLGPGSAELLKKSIITTGKDTVI